MGFLVPAFAAFAVLAAVPIALHLYGRPRVVRRRFAALRLLLESEQKTAARRRMQEVALLVLRALAICAVPLLLAKPYLESRSPAGGGIGERESAVIVLDDSRSMNARAPSALHLPGGPASSSFTRAIARARRLAESLGAESEAAILLTSQGASAPQAELTADRAQLLHALDGVKPTDRAGDTTAALRRAAAILGASPRKVRRVYLVSDLAAHGFGEGAPWIAGDEGAPQLVPMDVGAGGTKPPPNRAVTDVRLEPAPALGPRGVAVIATVMSFAEEPLAEQPLTLRVDGKPVATSLVDLPPRGAVTHRFVHALAKSPSEPGATGAEESAAPPAHEVAVELAPDLLESDDRRFARVEERPTVRVLLVDGDPRTVRREDELFYLETALAPGDRPGDRAAEAEGARLDVRVATPDELDEERLAGVDVVFLANVKAPDATRAAALERHVQGGGGLLLALGDNVDPDAWNAALAPLLPAPLATVRTVGRTLRARDDGESATAAPSLAADGERIARFDASHPVLAPFAEGGGGARRDGGDEAAKAPHAGGGSARPVDGGVAAGATTSTVATNAGPGASLREARVTRLVLLKPTAERDQRELLRLDDGAPLLVEGQLGRGRVLLLTTSLDRDWTDLPIQPAFLPLMQQAARYLARAALDAPEPPALVGDAHDVPLEANDVRVEITTPSGETRAFDEDHVRGRRALHFTETDTPGFYRVAVAKKGAHLAPRPAAGFVMNVAPSESDLARIAESKLAALTTAHAREGGAAPPRRVELWRALGALLLVLLLFEGALSLRR